MVDTDTKVLLCVHCGLNEVDRSEPVCSEQCYLDHECNSDDWDRDCDLCPTCLEHTGFCTVCGSSGCCG